MSDLAFLRKSEFHNLEKKIKEKKEKIKTYSFDKLIFERERCEQILNRNIPMCISMHTKKILQGTSRNQILGQLERLILESYWKILNLEYLELINKHLNKIK